jgi:hypothetical protein
MSVALDGWSGASVHSQNSVSGGRTPIVAMIVAMHGVRESDRRRKMHLDRYPDPHSADAGAPERAQRLPVISGPSACRT